MLKGKPFIILVLIIILPAYKQAVLPVYENELNTTDSQSSLRGTDKGGNSQPDPPLMSINKISQYTERPPIKIFNNSAFSSYGFPGAGTSGNPYQITDYNITSSSEPLIHIENTTAYFVIQDCLLDGISGTHTGIYLKNVTLGTISSNILSNNDYSCHLSDSSNNVIENNRISNTSDYAIRVAWGSDNNSLIDNEIQNSAAGVTIGPYSSPTRIFRNTITDVASHGVYVGSDSKADVINNTFTNIGGNGVLLSWYVGNNKIIGNIISNTSLASIQLSSTNYDPGAIISNNTILSSKQQGILFSGKNIGVSITRNIIFNCTGYGLEINLNSDNNEVRWNNFFHNNGDRTQAYDNGINNVFDFNHWNDHVVPDIDTDGVVETNYLIDGNPGTSKGGLSLSGTNSSYVNITPVSTFATDAITVELWMKSRDNNKYFSLVSYASSDSSDNDFLILYSAGGDQFQIYRNDSVVNTGCSVSENVWTHLVVTWRSFEGEITLWKDGVLEYTGNSSIGKNIGPGGSLVLGQDQDTVGGGFQTYQAFNGILDEVRILTSVLNQDEIQADYHVKEPYPVRSGTIAWYHLDDTGTNATDSAGGVGNGTVVGGEWVDGVPPPNFDSHPRVAPIWINENSDFADFAITGSGTEINPYIIREFHYSSSKSTLIHIENTSAYFVIQDCLLDGINKEKIGISLINVLHSTLVNNTIINCVEGISLTSSSNNSLTSNVVLKSANGISLNGSSNNNLSSNDAHQNTLNGFYLQEARNNTLIENYAYNNTLTGYNISSSSSNFLVRNFAGNNELNGYYLLEAYENTLSENVAISNRNGYSLQSCMKDPGNNLTENSASKNNAGFLLRKCVRTSLIRNNASENQHGYYLFESSSNIITSNTALRNRYCGVFLVYKASLNTLSGNTIIESGMYGLNLRSYSDRNQVTENTISQSYLYGIMVAASDQNKIWANIFFRNQIFEPESELYDRSQGYDGGSSNQWTNDTHGNYWSDYTGSDLNNDGIGEVGYPYWIDGPWAQYGVYKVWDGKPLVFSSLQLLSTLQVTAPESISIEAGSVDVFPIIWLPISNLDPNTYEIFKENERIKKPTDWITGYIIQYPIDVTALELGQPYNFTLVISDYSGKRVNHTVQVTVVDTTSPLVTNLGPKEYSFDAGSINSTIEISFSVSDLSFNLFTLYKNGTEIASWNVLFRDYAGDFGEFYMECFQATTEEVSENVIVHMDSIIMSSSNYNIEVRITLDLVDLLGGFYNYTVAVTDLYGNIGVMVIGVSVTGTPIVGRTPGWPALQVLLILIVISNIQKRRRKQRKTKLIQEVIK